MGTLWWYLGIVEAEKSDKFIISYMIRADSKGKSWTFPKTAKILETSVDQIIASKVKVEYLGSVRIQCILVFETLSNEMDNFVSFTKKK